MAIGSTSTPLWVTFAVPGGVIIAALLAFAATRYNARFQARADLAKTKFEKQWEAQLALYNDVLIALAEYVPQIDDVIIWVDAYSDPPTGHGRLRHADLTYYLEEYDVSADSYEDHPTRGLRYRTSRSQVPRVPQRTVLVTNETGEHAVSAWDDDYISIIRKQILEIRSQRQLNAFRTRFHMLAGEVTRRSLFECMDAEDRFLVDVESYLETQTQDFHFWERNDSTSLEGRVADRLQTRPERVDSIVAQGVRFLRALDELQENMRFDIQGEMSPRERKKAYKRRSPRSP